MMQVILRDAGFNLYSVSNGKQAVEYIPFGFVDLVLMDVHMPEMDGFSATGEIRKLKEPYNEVPIIAITAHAISGDKQKCLDAGMNDYIAKSFTPETLIQKVDKWLGIGHPIPKSTPVIKKEVKILDEDYLEEISLGNQDFLQDLLLTYIEDMDIRMNTLSKALTSLDMSSIILESHSIKGASFSIGVNTVGEAAKVIELAAKANDAETAKAKFNNLDTAFKEAKKYILDYLQ